MSDLHLSLMIFGLVVIVGVVTYNWIQEQKFRKIAQQRFQAPREDVLMASPEPVPDAYGATTETLDDVRIEPSMRAEIKAEPATATERATERTVEPVFSKPAAAVQRKSNSEDRKSVV